MRSNVLISRIITDTSKASSLCEDIFNTKKHKLLLYQFNFIKIWLFIVKAIHEQNNWKNYVKLNEKPEKMNAWSEEEGRS